MISRIPKRKPVPPGATEEDREKMYYDYLRELMRLNPGFNPKTHDWFYLAKSILVGVGLVFAFIILIIYGLR